MGKLEIIAASVADALAAEAFGADRIELVVAMSEGGLTPSIGLIRETLAAVSIPVHVMVRPHSRSFCYTEDELRVMCADIRCIREAGAAGIVTGALTEAGEVDATAMRHLMKAAEGMHVTYHRAFDAAADVFAAFHAICELPGIDRILTSGGCDSALDGEATIRRLVDISRGSGVTVLAGGGLKLDPLADFVRRTGVSEVHLGSDVRVHRSFDEPIDASRVTLAKRQLATM